MKKRLYKSNKFRMISGVCGGWAEMLNWDPTIIRVIFVLLSLFKGVGIILYLVLAVIMPSSFVNEALEEEKNTELDKINSVKKSNKKSKKADGIHTDKEFDDFFVTKK